MGLTAMGCGLQPLLCNPASATGREGYLCVAELYTSESGQQRVRAVFHGSS